MLIRRFIGNIIRNQKRRIPTTKPAIAFHSADLLNSSQEKKKSDSVLYFKHLLLRTVIRLFARTRVNRAVAAISSIDRVLRYSALGIQKIDQQSDTNHIGMRSGKFDGPGEEKEADDRSLDGKSFDESRSDLDELKRAYDEARRKSISTWLNISDKTCYIYLYRGGGEPNESMVAFDLDGTLIKPKSNKRIPRNATDWEFFSVWTKVKLQQCLREKRSRFVIFTNQNGVGLNIVPLDEVQKRIELVTKRLDIPCSVFVAIEKNKFRKPLTGMFELLEQTLNDSLLINRTSSFYCGDAIGYPSHSDADIKFAERLSLPFITPEKFLRGVKPKLVSPLGNESQQLSSSSSSSTQR